jgi:hypothetical protein
MLGFQIVPIVKLGVEKQFLIPAIQCVPILFGDVQWKRFFKRESARDAVCDMIDELNQYVAERTRPRGGATEPVKELRRLALSAKGSSGTLTIGEWWKGQAKRG